MQRQKLQLAINDDDDNGGGWIEKKRMLGGPSLRVARYLWQYLWRVAESGHQGRKRL